MRISRLTFGEGYTPMVKGDDCGSAPRALVSVSRVTWCCDTQITHLVMFHLPDLWNCDAPGLFKLLFLLTALGWCSESGLSWLWKMYNFWTESQVIFRDCSAFTGRLIENVRLGPVTSLAWFKKWLSTLRKQLVFGWKHTRRWVLKEFRGQEKQVAGLGRGHADWQCGNDWSPERPYGELWRWGGLLSCLQLRRRAGPVYSWVSQWLAAGCPFQGHYLRTFSVSKQQPGMGTLALKVKSGWSAVVTTTLSQRI